MDADLINLTRDAAAKRKEKKKRGRGRPRKEKISEEDEDPDTGFEFDGFFEEEPTQEEGGDMYFPDLGAMEQTGEDAPQAVADRNEKMELIAMIKELQNKLHAQGSNMKPNMEMKLSVLRDEFNLLNNEINARRAETMVKHLALEVIIPAIEKMAPYVIPQDQVDVSGMTQEAKNDYDEVFKDTLTHISILNRRWFALGPYGEFVNGVIKVGTKAATKNQLRKQIAAREKAMGQPPANGNEKIRRMYGHRVNKPDDNSDSDEDVEDKVQ